MGKTHHRYILGIVTVLVHVCTCNGNWLQQQFEQRKLRTPQIAQLRAYGDSGTVRLSCVARGRPPPAITWLFEGAPIVSGGRYELRYDNQSLLIIKNTNELDTGTYRCEAENKLGKIFDEIELKIKGVGRFHPTYREEDECQYRNVTVGLPYSLDCPPHTQAYGQQFKWIVKPLDVWKTGYPNDRLFQSPNGSLVFAYVKRSDVMLIERKGGLTCGLINKFTIVPSVSIKLWDDGNEFKGDIKPTISTFMDTSMEVVEGQQVMLMCGAIGKPLPKLTWFKDNKRIYSPLDGTLSKEVVVEGKGMVLKFRRIRSKHEGTYKCVAMNSAGSDAKEAKLVVNSHVKWGASLPQVQHINVFGTARLECKALGKPTPTYSWMHNGTALTATSSLTIKGGVLEFKKLDFNHAGLYLCIAANSVNKKVQSSYLNVKAFAPTFTTPLPKVAYFFTGTKNTLQCDVYGGPLPKIEWTKDGDVVGSSAQHVVNNAQKTDDGVYQCKATNVEGVIKASTKVQVFDKTKITQGPVDFSFSKASVANLFCEAEYDRSSDVSTNFKWFKDGQQLILNDADRIHKKKGMDWNTNGLQIVDLQASDGGAYTCQVETTNADKSFSTKDERSGSITVTGAVNKPSDVSFSGDCENDDEITLHWSAPTKYVGPASHYIIRYAHGSKFNKKDKYELDTDSPVTGTSYTIKTELLPHIPLRFCVQAVSTSGNVVVKSECSSFTDICVIPPVAPFFAPEEVSAISDNNGSVIVSWKPIEPIFQSGKEFEVVGKVKEIINNNVQKEDEEKVPGDKNSFKIKLADVKDTDDAKYEIVVYAQNEKGKGPATTLKIDHPNNLEDPTKVTNVKVDSVTDKSVTLTWDAVAAVQNYKIRCYESSDRRRRSNGASKPVAEVDVSGAQKGTVDGLEPSKKYQVTVAAKNVKSTGPESDPVDVKTAPGVPKDVDLNTYGDAIALSWTPEDDDNDDVTGYEVTWYPSDDPSKKKSKDVPKDADEAFIQKDLKPLTYYTVELKKKGKDQNGNPQDGTPWKMEGVVVGQPDRPGKPANPTLTGKNESTIDVKYNLPTDKRNSGGLPDSVNVYYQKQDDPSTLQNKSFDYPQQTSTLLTNLDPVPYQIWVVPANKQGKGKPSDKQSSMPLIPPPTTPDPNVTVIVISGESRSDGGKEFYAELWFIILIALILLILLIALIICAVMNNGNAGRYPVGQKEKKYGGWDNQQLQDYSDNPMDKPNGMPFNAYVTLDQGNQPTHHVIRDKRSASDNSIAKVPILNDCEDDNDSLELYQEDGKFNEDGSFIGQYGDEKQSYTNNALV